MRLPFGVTVALLLGASMAGRPGLATPPTFSAPLDITNPYHPFQPGGMKVFAGRKDGAASVIVDLYLTDTRTFDLAGTAVRTRILQETEFQDGDVEEISRNYFAQADDGTVFYFGEVVDEYADGAVVGHEGSWLVGGPSSDDPADTANASAPTVFMPPAPMEGDTFKPEDLFPLVDETVTVKRTGLRVEVRAGRFDEAIQVLETSALPDSTPEKKWYAAGVGVVKGRARGESFALVASTLRPR
jgi:hypothetical protein